MKCRSFAITVLCTFASLPIGLSGQSKPITMQEMHKLHQDSKAYIAMLDDPARDADQKPHEVVMALGLKEGERIADIGAGSGYFSLRFAQHVGALGLVLAVDINPDMIVHLNQRIRDAGLDNVRTILALPDDPLLAAVSVDRVFICDTWHHIEGHAQYLAGLKRALKPGGRDRDHRFPEEGHGRRPARRNENVAGRGRERVRTERLPPGGGTHVPAVSGTSSSSLRPRPPGSRQPARSLCERPARRVV